jgi:hypothetical protein
MDYMDIEVTVRDVVLRREQSPTPLLLTRINLEQRLRAHDRLSRGRYR